MEKCIRVSRTGLYTGLETKYRFDYAPQRCLDKVKETNNMALKDLSKTRTVHMEIEMEQNKNATLNMQENFTKLHRYEQR